MGNSVLEKVSTEKMQACFFPSNCNFKDVPKHSSNVSSFFLHYIDAAGFAGTKQIRSVNWFAWKKIVFFFFLSVTFFLRKLVLWSTLKDRYGKAKAGIGSQGNCRTVVTWCSFLPHMTAWFLKKRLIPVSCKTVACSDNEKFCNEFNLAWPLKGLLLYCFWYIKMLQI